MSSKNFTKKELANKIYRDLGFSKNFSASLIDDFINVFTSDLMKNNKVKISNFGTFEILNKNERVGRNPKTKKEAKISARKVVKFKTSLLVKKKLNNYEHR